MVEKKIKKFAVVPVVDWLVGFVIERVPRAKGAIIARVSSLFAPRLETPSPRPIAVSAPSSFTIDVIRLVSSPFWAELESSR